MACYNDTALYNLPNFGARIAAESVAMRIWNPIRNA